MASILIGIYHLLKKVKLKNDSLFLYEKETKFVHINLLFLYKEEQKMEGKNNKTVQIIQTLKKSCNNVDLFKTMYDIFTKENIIIPKGYFSSAKIDIYRATKFCGNLIKQLLSSNESPAKRCIYDVFNTCIKIILLVKTGVKANNIEINNQHEDNADINLENYVKNFDSWFRLNFNFCEEMNSEFGLKQTYNKIGLKYDDFVDLVQCVFRNLLVNVVNPGDKLDSCQLEDLITSFYETVVDIRLEDLTKKPKYQQGIRYKDICIVLDVINKCFPDDSKSSKDIREDLAKNFMESFDSMTDFIVYRKDGLDDIKSVVTVLTELTPASNVFSAVFNKTKQTIKVGVDFLSNKFRLTKRDILPNEVISKIDKQADDVLFDLKQSKSSANITGDTFAKDIFFALTGCQLNDSKLEQNVNNCLKALYNSENEFLFDLNSWFKKLDDKTFWLVKYALNLVTNAMEAKFPGDFSLQKINQQSPMDELFVPNKKLANQKNKKNDIVTQHLCMNENLRKIYFTFETCMLNKLFNHKPFGSFMVKTLQEKFGSMYNCLISLRESMANKNKYPNTLAAIIGFFLESLSSEKVLDYVKCDYIKSKNSKLRIYDIKAAIVIGFMVAKFSLPSVSKTKSQLTNNFKGFALKFVRNKDFKEILVYPDDYDKTKLKTDFEAFINDVCELSLKDCCAVFLLDRTNQNKDSKGEYITNLVSKLKELNLSHAEPQSKLDALHKIQPNENKKEEKENIPQNKNIDTIDKTARSNIDENTDKKTEIMLNLNIHNQAIKEENAENKNDKAIDQDKQIGNSDTDNKNKKEKKEENIFPDKNIDPSDKKSTSAVNDNIDKAKDREGNRQTNENLNIAPTQTITKNYIEVVDKDSEEWHLILEDNNGDINDKIKLIPGLRIINNQNNEVKNGNTDSEQEQTEEMVNVHDDDLQADNKEHMGVDIQEIKKEDFAKLNCVETVTELPIESNPESGSSDENKKNETSENLLIHKENTDNVQEDGSEYFEGENEKVQENQNKRIWRKAGVVLLGIVIFAALISTLILTGVAIASHSFLTIPSIFGVLCALFGTGCFIKNIKKLWSSETVESKDKKLKLKLNSRENVFISISEKSKSFDSYSTDFSISDEILPIEKNKLGHRYYQESEYISKTSSIKNLNPKLQKIQQQFYRDNK